MATSSPTPTPVPIGNTTMSTTTTTLNMTTTESDNRTVGHLDKIFLQTTAAQGIAGAFTFAAILITTYQVSSTIKVSSHLKKNECENRIRIETGWISCHPQVWKNLNNTQEICSVICCFIPIENSRWRWHMYFVALFAFALFPVSSCLPRNNSGHVLILNESRLFPEFWIFIHSVEISCLKAAVLHL